ncbi:MAG: Uncharacterized protein FD155_3367 [Bacteroidetes bacterium]|nr:MAG: Uncharacterized protein FD155_3367 [Bacteroidota bacterium]
MKPQSYVVATIPFKEHPYTTNADEGEHLITIKSPFTSQKYSEKLFQKLLTIGLSEIAPFLDFQCTNISEPIIWLNNLEKLIKVNISAFNTNDHKHRHTKLISQIDIKRHSLQEKISRQGHKPKKKVNGYTADKEYSFSQVKDFSSKYETCDEKIAFIQDQIFDYRLNPPEYINQKELPFDKQCELEIERLEKQEVMQQKIQSHKTKTMSITKLPFNGDLKTLCDVFYQMMRKKTNDREPILPWSIAQAVEFICNAFCYADGSSINPSTVRTYLSSSKPENRPKNDSEFDID